MRGRGTIALPQRGFALFVQGFRPELMTKDSSGAKLLASDAVLPHAHRVALPASVLWSRSLWVFLSP